MSGQATGWVLRDGPRPSDVGRDGKPYGQRARGLRAVLVTIADAANRDGQHAHPGQQAMVDGSLYGRSQVVAIVRELLAEGWVTIEAEGGGRGKATVYAVNMARRETGRSLDGSGNRAVEDAEPRDLATDTARSEADTARSHLADQGERDANGLCNGTPNEEHNARAAEPLTLVQLPATGPTFDTFWSLYPRGDGKPAARAAWDKAVKAAPPETIMDGLARWVSYWTARAQPEFVPWAQKWLRQEQWNAEPPVLGRGDRPTGPGPRAPIDSDRGGAAGRVSDL